MIAPSELRLGNWVHHGDVWTYRQPDQGPFIGFDFQWEERDWYAIGESTMNFEDMAPIEISPNWLVRFGFSMIYYKGMQGRYDNYQLNEFEIHGMGDGLFTFMTRKITHVHHLQNLYYALIGEDLKLKK